ncbi:VQ motif-containing protein 22 [Rhodamnia argentea]|uniref:VQ motif-containing protein 22 n=1 Tax=Rhodamnia argentea TaxID=178133 RepID=A0A8B8QWC2_9MYRT|nr:VQ motif-containing protein 22 [Rhodamnia argentea]
MTNNGSEEWVQYYQQSVDPQAEFVDSTIVTSMSSSNSTDQNPANPGCNNNSNSIIKSQSKPTRRRSRASKKTPTTILNANTTNFRALVQQFTGCPSTSISFGSTHRCSPLNLSFVGFGHEQQVVSSAEASLRSDYSYGVQVQHQARPSQQLHQEQSEYASMMNSSFNEVTDTDDAFASTMPLSSNFMDVATEDIFSGYPMDDLPYQV